MARMEEEADKEYIRTPSSADYNKGEADIRSPHSEPGMLKKFGFIENAGELRARFEKLVARDVPINPALLYYAIMNCAGDQLRIPGAIKVNLAQHIMSLAKQRKDLAITANHYNALIRVYLKNGEEFDADLLLKEMRDRGIELDSEIKLNLAKFYGYIGDVRQVRAFYNELKLQTKIVDDVIFRALIAAHVVSKNTDAIPGILEEMKEMGVAFGARSFRKLLQLAEAHGSTPLAITTLQLMKDRSVRPSLSAYFSLMKVFAANKEFSQLSELVTMKEESGFLVYPELEVDFVQAFLEGDFERALAIYKDYKSKGVELIPQIIETISSALAFQGNGHEAIRFFYFLLDHTIEVHPDVYQNLFCAMSKEGRFNSIMKALNILREKEGWTKDAALYDYAIQALSHSDAKLLHSKVDEVAKLMKQDRVRINRPVFHSILEAYSSKSKSRHASPDGVASIITWMDRLGMVHDARSWVARLDARTNSKYHCTREEIYAIKAEMEKADVSRSLRVIKALIRAHLAIGDIDIVANTLIPEIKARNLTPDAEVYAPLIEYYLNAGKQAEARDVINSIDKDVHITSAFYLPFFKQIAHHGTPDEALQLLIAMREKEVEPDRATFDQLFQTYARAEDTENIVTLLKTAGPKNLSNRTIGHIFESLSEKVSIESIKEIMQVSRSLGLAMSSDALAPVLAVWASRFGPEQSQELMSLIKSGPTNRAVSSREFNRLTLEAALSSGNLDRAVVAIKNIASTESQSSPWSDAIRIYSRTCTLEQGLALVDRLVSEGTCEEGPALQVLLRTLFKKDSKKLIHSDGIVILERAAAKNLLNALENHYFDLIMSPPVGVAVDDQHRDIVVRTLKVMSDGGFAHVSADHTFSRSMALALQAFAPLGSKFAETFLAACKNANVVTNADFKNALLRQLLIIAPRQASVILKDSELSDDDREAALSYFVYGTGNLRAALEMSQEVFAPDVLEHIEHNLVSSFTSKERPEFVKVLRMAIRDGLIHLTDRNITSIIKGCSLNKTPVTWLTETLEKANILHSPQVQRDLLIHYREAGDGGSAFQTLQDIKSSGSATTPEMIVDVLVAESRNKHFANLSSIYQDALKSGIVFTPAHLAKIAQAFASTEGIEQAKVIIDQLVAQGHELPTPLRNALIMHFANVGDIKQAQTEFDAIISAGQTATEWSYHPLIKAYAHSGNTERAFELLQQFRSKDKYVKKPTLAYNYILEGCLRHGKLEQAKAVIVALKHDKVPFDKDTYFRYIKLQVLSGKQEEALTIIAHAKATLSDFRDTDAIRALVSAYNASGAYDKLLELIKTPSFFNLENLRIATHTLAAYGRLEFIDEIVILANELAASQQPKQAEELRQIHINRFYAYVHADQGLNALDALLADAASNFTSTGDFLHRLKYTWQQKGLDLSPLDSAITKHGLRFGAASLSHVDSQPLAAPRNYNSQRDGKNTAISPITIA